MNAAIRGSCVCGAVAFRIEAPFRGFQYCHCSRCRKKTGSSNAANILVPVGQFSWERGENNLKRFELPNTKYWSTAFCMACGSAMPWLTRTGKAMVVGAGSLDDDPGVQPTHSVFFGSRAPWYVHVSDLEMHETLPQS
ncbi:MAG: GFA family protein [Deltaproteobacteria bacterium]|nr:GFA family protein [Deltaproteobacteria bacterium]MBW1876276.1 GFA family protein [Deltaproteobacteria bacterium]MBW2210003.1 GFA family protein [Deltaproteobacteria bacterium]MBW2379418.1 GFA family protein [Deltaproteobacteria bacterium]MBW2550959.1 GFA family protein [Deltaproteobacteria bacterium]